MLTCLTPRGWTTGALARDSLGADAYLCCPGPSLINLEPSRLRVPGAMVFALNTAYPKVRPDVWISMDYPTCYDRQVWMEPFIKIGRAGYQDVQIADRRLRDCPATYFAQFRTGSPEDVADATKMPFVWNRNTFLLALHVMVYMGAKRIHLVGADFGGAADYHDERKLSESNRGNNRLLLADTVKALPGVHAAMKGAGIELLSCTEGSAANAALPYLPLGAAIEQTAAKARVAPGPILHSRDSECTKWRHPDEVRDQQGVLVGTDDKQEWLLPWWWGRYRRHNAYPVAFADFGMSAQARAWCQVRGEIVKVEPALPGIAWWRKPFAILQSPFRQTLWMDIDIDTRGDVGPIFDYGRGGVGASFDVCATIHYGASIKGRIYGGGLLSVAYGEPAITEWAARTLAEPGKYRNDQHVLSAVLKDSGRAKDIPDLLHWHSVNGPRPDALLYHWVGRTGKEAIRQMIDAEAYGSTNSIPSEVSVAAN